mgnify:CR=1 FL=1
MSSALFISWDVPIIGKVPVIICTQPRRISAIGVAERVAQERDEKAGNLIGYQIRLESKTSSMTRLLFCTTGILVSILQKLNQNYNFNYFTFELKDNGNLASLQFRNFAILIDPFVTFLLSKEVGSGVTYTIL